MLNPLVFKKYTANITTMKNEINVIPIAIACIGDLFSVLFDIRTTATVTRINRIAIVIMIISPC